MTHDIMLYNTVLAKKQAVSQITCNPTLDAFDLDYCKILDELAKTDKFVEDRVGICIKELGLAGGIDFNGHYINAFDAYNEAVTYYDMLQRGVTIRNIPEASSSTPDFEVEFSYRNGEGEQTTEKVFLEVKSLAYANGNLEYNKCKKQVFDQQFSEKLVSADFGKQLLHILIDKAVMRQRAAASLLGA